MKSQRIKIRKNQSSFPLDKLDFDCTHLEIIGENLSALPNELNQLNQLTHFYLQAPVLEKYPSFLNELEGLINLKFKNTPLINFPEERPHGNWTFFKCSNANLDLLPNWLGELPLEELDLGSNQLKTLPESFKNLKSLKRINLEKNQFESLPSWICDWVSLNHICLDNNPLSEEAKNDLYKQFGIWF